MWACHIGLYNGTTAPDLCYLRLLDFYTRLELNACKRQLENRLRSNWIEYKDPPIPEEYDGVPF